MPSATVRMPSALASPTTDLAMAPDSGRSAMSSTNDRSIFRAA
jgi:hypothetical protein